MLTNLNIFLSILFKKGVFWAFLTYTKPLGMKIDL
jgi:hypothetical protein